MYACFAGYIVQAIVNNFVPLLFLTFEKTYQVPLSQITMLITFNFGIQLLIDLLAARFVDRIGYRVPLFWLHIFSAAGLIGLVILPNLCSSAFIGLLISVVIYAIGGRSDRGTDQPHCGELSRRSEGKSDESAAFFLLLGACRGSPDFHDIFPGIRNGELEDHGAYLGVSSCCQRDCLYQSSDCVPGGGR